MKVLQVTHHFHPCVGGIETFVKDLCLNLAKNGIEVSVFCLDKCPKSKKKLPREETVEGISVLRLPFIDLKYYKLAGLSISSLEKFDAIHVHNIGFFSDFLLLTKFIHKKPVIVSTHGGIMHSNDLWPVKKIYLDFFQRFMLKKADLVIADSINDHELFSKIHKKTVLFENAFNFSKFFRLEKNHFNENFLFVGRLSKNKNITGLIHVFSVVVKKFPSAKLFIAGKNFDEDLDSINSLIKGNSLEKNVFILGEVPEKKLFRLIDESSFCISASNYEGFGISVLELMAGGLIPILNEIPNFKGFVEDKKNGFVTDFNLPQLASEKICEVISFSVSRKKSISENAKKTVRKFSWENKIHDYVGFYETVVMKTE